MLINVATAHAPPAALRPVPVALHQVHRRRTVAVSYDKWSAWRHCPTSLVCTAAQASVRAGITLSPPTLPGDIRRSDQAFPGSRLLGTLLHQGRKSQNFILDFKGRPSSSLQPQAGSSNGPKPTRNPKDDTSIKDILSDNAAPVPQGFPSWGVWVLFGAYIVWLFILPYAPGDPAWQIQPETLEEVTQLSLNFFYVLPVLNAVGVHAMEAPSLHPAAEALFNFVNSWSLMFGPLLILDSQARSSPPRETRAAGLWSAQMFLTNVFLIPYMAQRLEGQQQGSTVQKKEHAGVLGRLAGALVAGRRGIGAVGLAVAALSVYWFVSGRSGEGFGDSLTDRWTYFYDYVSTNRLAYAFILDILLYSAFQIWLARDILDKLSVKKEVPAVLKSLSLVPCFGLGIFLLLI